MGTHDYPENGFALFFVDFTAHALNLRRMDSFS